MICKFDSSPLNTVGAVSIRFGARAIIATGILCLIGATPASAQHMGFGCVPSPAEAFASHPHVKIAAKRGLDRPKMFSLAADLPPVGDQGETGSCVGWSTAYYCYTTSVARQRKLTAEQRKDTKFIFSPAFIWHQFNKGDAEEGMHIFQAFDILAKQGCAPLADMPWNEKEVKSQPDDAAKAKALKYKARQTVSLFKGTSNGEPGNAERLKNWLWETRQPFVIGIPVYKEFFGVPHDPNFVYAPTDKKGELLGLHAVCICGYDEDKKAFLMVNSWTTKWAANGFVWLSEDFVTKEAIEGWGQRPGGPIARTKGPVQLTADIILEPAEAVK